MPAGHVPNEAGEALAAAAQPIFNACSRTRGALTAPIAKKLVAPVREAFGDGTGLCHPGQAAGWIAEDGDELPACAKAGEYCEKDADCCSSDCHDKPCHQRFGRSLLQSSCN